MKRCGGVVLCLAYLLMFRLLFAEPVLIYSTYLGGSRDDGTNDWLEEFSIDDAGNIWFTTCTYSTNFPVTDDAYDKTYNGGNDWGTEDVAIVHFNINQNELKYASYFGGSTGPDFVSQVLKHEDQIYLVGNTGSTDLPVTDIANEGTYQGPVFRHTDGFLAQFNNNQLDFATYIATPGQPEWLNDVLINDAGETIVVGVMKNIDDWDFTYRFSEESLSESPNGCVIRFDEEGHVLSSTVLGPVWHMDSVLDSKGNIVLAGSTPSSNFPVTVGAYDTHYNGGTKSSGGDVFVMKLSPSGDDILFSTFLGGSGDDSWPKIAINSQDEVVVFGLTDSKDFPMTATSLQPEMRGGEDFFIAKLSSDGSQLLGSTYLGGTESQWEFCQNVVIDETDEIYIAGTTDASDFPITGNAIQSEASGEFDIVITKLSPNLKNIEFSTYLGGSSNDGAVIQVDNQGCIIGVGSTNSRDFPITPGAYDETKNGGNDAVVFKIDLTNQVSSIIRSSTTDAVFQGLGDFPGGSFESFSQNVSADGRFIVGNGQTETGAQAFLWTEASGLTSLGNFAEDSFHESWASDVSADGSVIVGYGNPGAGWDDYQGFKWTEETGMVLTGSLNGSARSTAWGVSADGTVIVGDGGQHAFRWSETSGMEDLGTLPGYTNSRAIDVSDNGLAVTGSCYPASWSREETFYWTPETGMQSIGFLNPGSSSRNSFPNAISPDGKVVVGTSTSSNGYVAFRWTSEEGMMSLGHLPGMNTTHPGDASLNGEVVVGGSYSGPTTGKAFIWDAEHGMRQLQSVLETDYGLDLSEWDLQSASGITPDGNVIVGWGKNPDGNMEGFRVVLDGSKTNVTDPIMKTGLRSFELEPNYPNPFNPVTTIPYHLDKPMQVSLKIYNTAGQLVETLKNELLPAGQYTALWDASGWASGVYVCCLKAGSGVAKRQMMLVR